MADHRLAHPQDVDGCFGCHVYGIGFDGGHTTRETRDRDRQGRTKAVITEHRDGRQDVDIRAPRVRQVSRTVEERD